jgi:hypothetical protein
VLCRTAEHGLTIHLCKYLFRPVFYSQKYFVFVLVALALIWLKHALATGEWAAGLGAFACIGLISLPVLSLVGYDIGQQLAMRQGKLSLAAVGYTGWSLLTGFCIGPSLRELHTMSSVEAIQRILPWLLPVGAVVCGLLGSLMRKTHPYRVELLTLLFFPMVCAFLIASCFDLSSFNVRYVIPSLLPLIILLAVALTADGKKTFSTIMGLVLVTVSLCSIMHRHQFATYQNIDSRAACKFIADCSAEPQTVYSLAHYMQVAARHYSAVGTVVIPLDDVTSESQNLDETIQLINSHEGPFWVFYSRAFHGDPEGLFKRAMLDDPLVEHQGTWTGVELFHGTGPITARRATQTP